MLWIHLQSTKDSHILNIILILSKETVTKNWYFTVNLTVKYPFFTPSLSCQEFGGKVVTIWCYFTNF